jgi:alpha-glucosidase
LRLLADWPPESVRANGQPLVSQPSDANSPGWHYDGNTLSTIIRVPSQLVSKAVQIEIRRSSDAIATRAQLDGFAGATARLRSAYDTLNQEWPFTWSPDPLIQAWQTGDRLGYHPETAHNELAQFARKYTAAQASVQQLLDSVANLSDDQLIEQLMKRPGAEKARERAKQYRTSLKLAIAQLKDGKP